MQVYYCGFFSLDSTSQIIAVHEPMHSIRTSDIDTLLTTMSKQTLIDVFDDGEKKIASIRNFFNSNVVERIFEILTNDDVCGVLPWKYQSLDEESEVRA